MTFNDLGLDPLILKALQEAGYNQPTDIQAQAIPVALAGSDIRGAAQTGTGKTAAFLLPALNRLSKPSEIKSKGPRVLILAPTRELALQITTQAEKYSKHLKFARTVCVYGGVPYPVQIRKLNRTCDILVATPGRLIDLMDRGLIDFSRLEMLVLDEADRMLDMGFVKPVEKIVSATPKSRQTLLFTATLQGSVVKLSEKLLNEPQEIVIEGTKDRHENIDQTIHYADNLGHKYRLLDHILGRDDLKNAIVFTATKRHAETLTDDLETKGHRSAALHGDMSQRQRTRTIKQLRNGTINILVATDVAARGIDVPDITHVVNFDLPQCAEDYVHRIGRTGRAGNTGQALSLASSRDAHLVKQIEKFTGQKIGVTEVKGLEPRAKKGSFKPQRKKPRNQFRRKKY